MNVRLQHDVCGSAGSCEAPLGACPGSERYETFGLLLLSLRIKSYRSWRINDTASSDAISRLRKLKLYALLASEGCSPASRLQATGWSKAACPVAGLVMLKACSRPSSRNAAGFLKYLIAQLPFTLKSIQVDGGSEFRDEFEQTCKDLDIKLYVLSPRKPKWNGCVERANGAGRYELYPFYQGRLTLAAVKRALSNYQWTCNHYRPHDSLALMTPVRYYQKLTAAA